jgi:CDGSH-type Zn-finger protein
MAMVNTKYAVPHFIDVVEGKNYLWCACSKSARQPFCDGSHAGSGTEPVQYTAQTTRRVMFCGCKSSKKAPICDGSHNRI